MIGPIVQGFLLIGVVYWYSKGMLSMINDYYRDEFRQYIDKDGKKNLILKPKAGSTPTENALKSISDLSPKIEGLPDIFLKETTTESDNPSVTISASNENRSPFPSPRKTTSNRDGVLTRGLDSVNSENEEKSTASNFEYNHVDSNLELLISSLKDTNKKKYRECEGFKRENDDEDDDDDDGNDYSNENIGSDKNDRSNVDISCATRNKFPSETYLHSEELLNSRKSNYKSHLSVSDSKLEEKSILNPSASTDKLNYRQITNQQVPINSNEKTTTEEDMRMKNENQDITNTTTIANTPSEVVVAGYGENKHANSVDVNLMKIPKLIETKVSSTESETLGGTEKESPSSISSKFMANWRENDNKISSSSSKSNLNELNIVSKERRKSDSYGIVNSIRGASDDGDDKNSNKVLHYGNVRTTTSDGRNNPKGQFPFLLELHSAVDINKTNRILRKRNENEMEKDSNENTNEFIDNNLNRLSVDTISKSTIPVNNGICRRKSVTEMVQFWSNYQENN